MKILKRQLPLWNTDTLFCPIIINICWNYLIKFWSPETFSALFFSLSMILVCLFVFSSTLFDRCVQSNLLASRIKFKISRNFEAEIVTAMKNNKTKLVFLQYEPIKKRNIPYQSRCQMVVSFIQGKRPHLHYTQKD